MSWSGIKRKFRPFLAPEVQERIDFHITSYRRDFQTRSKDAPALGRGWITIDGAEVAAFSGKAARLEGGNHFDSHTLGDKQELYEALETYPNLSIEDARNSPSAVVRALSLLDRRFGKKRLAELQKETLTSLELRFLELRQPFEQKRPGTKP